MKVKKKIEMLCSSNIKCSESEEGPSMALLPWLHPSKYLVTISFSLQWWDSYRNTQYQMNKEWASQVALVIKNLPAKAGDIGDGARVHLFWVRKILGGGNGNPLQLVLLGEIPWTEETGGLQPMWSQRVRHNWEHFIAFFGITLRWKFYKFQWKRRAQRLDKPFLLS